MNPEVQMQHWEIRPQEGFKVLGGSSRSEAATMVLTPGEASGEGFSTHQGDQWLFVLAGKGRAVIGDQTTDISSGTLVLIEAGEPHRIENNGGQPLETLNFDASPEY
jgi:mannose-6-phosphate isomerase-like protein (cupin superfamily)